MMADGFVTVFDLAALDAPSSPDAATMIGLAAIGAVLALVGLSLRRRAQLSWMLLLLAVVAWADAGMQYQAQTRVPFDYWVLKAAVAKRSYEIVQGTVINFHAMAPGSNYDWERFDLPPYRFGYADSYGTAAFKRISAFGGPIKNGLYLRITFVVDDRAPEHFKNKIVKLEIRRPF